MRVLSLDRCGTWTAGLAALALLAAGCSAVDVDHLTSGPGIEPYLRSLVERNEGNVAAAAREAQMDRTYLTRLLKKRGVKTRRDFPE